MRGKYFSHVANQNRSGSQDALYLLPRRKVILKQAVKLNGRFQKKYPRPFDQAGTFKSVVASALLDRRGDHVAVFGPAAVVIFHVRNAEQIFQREPRVARALADAAV